MRWAFAAAGLAVLLCLSDGASVLAALKRCTVSANSVRFGSYYPFSSADTLGSGTIAYNCTGSTPIIITIDKGSSNSYSQRTMKQGSNALDYNLYVDPANRIVWGDGTGGTSFYSNTAPPVNTTVAVTVYGRIPARQRSVHIGSYADTLTAQITF